VYPVLGECCPLYTRLSPGAFMLPETTRERA
jgi:hypothetical protein